MSAKQALRKQIAGVLAELDTQQIARQSQQAATVLRQLAAYRSARSVAFYMHMDTGELQTSDMIANAFHDGKRVFLPHIAAYKDGEAHAWFPTQKTHLRMLEMPSWEAVAKLEPRGKYKLKEPLTGTDALPSPGLDLIVLPGVAFSREGGRLGHGAGFYDSYVREHENHTGRVPALVGVGLAEQTVDRADLPLAAHDWPLDGVILDGRFYPGEQEEKEARA